MEEFSLVEILKAFNKPEYDTVDFWKNRALKKYGDKALPYFSGKVCPFPSDLCGVTLFDEGKTEDMLSDNFPCKGLYQYLHFLNRYGNVIHYWKTEGNIITEAQEEFGSFRRAVYESIIKGVAVGRNCHYYLINERNNDSGYKDFKCVIHSTNFNDAYVKLLNNEVQKDIFNYHFTGTTESIFNSWENRFDESILNVISYFAEDLIEGMTNGEHGYYFKEINIIE